MANKGKFTIKRSKKSKYQTGGVQLPGLADLNAQGGDPGNDFPTIDPTFDPMDQTGPHAESNNSQQQQGGFLNTQAGQRMGARYNRNAAYVKDFNLGATAITSVSNAIGGQKQKREEYLQTLKSITPKFMTNTNQGGLNNTPAYTEYGGEVDYMMVGGVSGPGQYDYSNKSNEEYGYEGIAHNAFYGQNSIYKTGGGVTSDKAKEILRDGTVHGQALTDKQKRYFGWIAGGKKMMGGRYQTGGQPAPTQQQSSPEDYYKASATLSYYKDKLNDQLKTKNPQAFSDYFKGLQGARKTGQIQGQEYVQNAKYDDYLSPDEVKKTLGSDKDYQNYLSSLKQVNQYDISQGRQPLYGTKEGENDPSQLNYGRRFASLQVTPTYGKTLQSSSGDKHYNRNYKYNPQTGQVDFTEVGDASIRPEGFSAPVQQSTSTTSAVISRKYGGKKTYMIGGQVAVHHMSQAYKTSGYNVGDEVDLTPAQIKELKKQGYKIKVS